MTRDKTAEILRGADGPVRLAREAAASTGDDLPGVRFAQLEHGPELPVAVVERLAKQVRGAFGGRQLLQQCAERELQRFAALDIARRIGVEVDCLDGLRSDVRLAAGACGLDDVDREVPRRGG